MNELFKTLATIVAGIILELLINKFFIAMDTVFLILAPIVLGICAFIIFKKNNNDDDNGWGNDGNNVSVKNDRAI